MLFIFVELLPDLSVCRRRAGKGYEIGVDISLKRAGNAPKLIPDSDVGSTHRLQKRLDLIRSTPFGSSNIVVISRTMRTARMHLLTTENGSFLRRKIPETLNEIQSGFNKRKIKNN